MPLILFVDADTKKATSKIKSASKQAGKDVKQLETKSVSSAAKMTASFKRLAGIAGIGGVSFALKAAIGQLFKFETALAEVSTLVDTSVVSMRGFNVEILKLTTGIPKSAVDITKGLYQVISAGVTDASDALLVLEVSAKAATGGLTDTNTAVKAITTILNSYQKNISEATNVSDILFTTVRLGTLRFANIAESIGIVSTSAALAGVTFEELSAALSTMTKFGIKTEISVTALNRLFLQIVNPSTQLKENSKDLGVEFSAAALRAKGFAAFMAELTEKFKEDEDAIFALGLDLRAFRALAVLGGKGADEFVRQLGEMALAAGAAEVAFGKINKTAEAQSQLLKNRLNVDWLEFGNAVLPVVVFAFDALLFAMSPVSSMLDTYDKAIADAKKRTDDIVPTLGGFATAMLNAAQAQAKFFKAKAGESSTKDEPFTLLQARREQDIEALEARLKIREVSETDLTLTLQALGVTRETFELQQDLILLAQNKVLLEQASNTIITTRLKKVNEIFDLEVQARINAINAAEAADDLAKQQEKVADSQQRSAIAAGRFSQNLARALVSGQGLEKSLLSAAISLGLSFLPGGSVFGGFFGHGGIAPGGFVPSIIGEGGGAPEIVQSESPIRVTPLTTNNNNRQNISVVLNLPNVGTIDKFELRNVIIPLITEEIERGTSELTATRLRS